ncbi:MAG: polysaccharide deacetylase family protein [Nitrospirae bacterium]|nr:polysaccharide deacetylase family protein [Nitrospirota bacterium]
MKIHLRQYFLWILHWTGLLWLWRFYHRNEIGILMVHGVMDEEEPTVWVPLRPQLSCNQLESSLRFLSKYYRFTSLQDAVDMLTGKIPMRPYSLVLTLDDGYRNHITHALPILRRYGAPATFFLSTGHIEQRKPFWFDRLDYILQHADVHGRRLLIGHSQIRLDASDKPALRRSYKQLRDIAKSQHQQDIEMLQEMEDIARTLETESGQSITDVFEGDPWSAVMRWEEVKEAAREEFVTLGSHTVDHIRLAHADDETIENQLRRSKEMIENHTGQSCVFLCYPDGSYNKHVMDMARKTGYEAAVTTKEGFNSPGTDLMALRRFNLPRQGTRTELLAVVSGFMNRTSRIKGTT